METTMKETYEKVAWEIDGFIAWVYFCRWLREDFPAFSQAEALRSAGTKPCITLDAEPDDQPDGLGAHWR